MPTSTATIAATTDDGYFTYYRNSDTFGFVNNGTQLVISGFEGDDDDNPSYRNSFLRFTGTLPSQGDSLTSATLSLTPTGNTVGLNFRIYGCSDISPSAPTNNSMGYELGRTSNYVSVTSSTSTNTTEQHDVTSIVQEMLNDPDFGGGEIMFILVEDMSDANQGTRSYHSSGSATSSYRPSMDLNWSSGGGTNATTLRRRLTLDQDTDGTITSNALSASAFVASNGSAKDPTTTSSTLSVNDFDGDDDDDPEDSRVYLRFSGNASSQLAGSTISSATLYYKGGNSGYSDGDVLVLGHAAASPDMPGALSGFSSLPETTASVGLPDLANIEIGANSWDYTERYSVDVTSVVQELVNVSSYDGSAVMLILRGDGTFGSSSAGSYSLSNPSGGFELYLDVEFEVAAGDTQPTGLGDEIIWIQPDSEGDATDNSVSNFGDNGQTLSFDSSASGLSVTDGGIEVYELSGTIPQSIATSNSTSLASDSDVTMAGWFKLDSSPSSTVTLMSTSAFGLSGFRLHMGATTITANFGYGGSAVSASGSHGMSSGTWYHVALVSDKTNDTGSLYIDGTLIDDVSLSSLSGSCTDTTFRVGANNYSTSSELFDGRVNDIRVYDRAITSAELSHLASAQNVSGAPTSISADCDDVQSSSQASQVDVSASILVDTIAVTVVSSSNSYGAGNKYSLDSTISKGTELAIDSGTGRYRFDLSDSSLSGHPLAFSETPNGTHAGGTKYTTGYTLVGTPGSPGAYADLEVEINSTPYLYYYCENHSGMGSDPWTGENFPQSGPIAEVFGWRAFSESSSQPRQFFNTFSYVGYDGSFADPSTVFMERTMSSNGTLSWNYQSPGSSSYIRVYKDGALELTDNNNLSGSSSLDVEVGDVIKFTFENATSAVGIRDLELEISATAEATSDNVESNSQCSEVLLYKTRPVTRTAHFW